MKTTRRSKAEVKRVVAATLSAASSFLLYVLRDEYAPLTTSLPSSSINVWQLMAAACLPTAFADKQSLTTTYLAMRD
jgi:hypothetical protein